MNFAVKDHSQRSLLEISLAFNPELLREFFFRRQGIWRYGYIVLADCALLLLCCAKQIVLPHYFPEIPCYAAVLLLAYLGSRRALAWSLLLAVAGGILLDSGNFLPLGPSSLLLCLLVYLAFLQTGGSGPQKHPALLSLQQCLCATSIFVLLNLLFLAGSLSWTARLALLPRQLLLGVLVNAVFAGPLLFALLDGTERLLFGQAAGSAGEA
ncbi:MAG: hypothetical protein GX564_00005 [Oligosphaeraceae bacterium]|nr:hypothetical protein [Oligosphaeraceae bacterium]